jgi:Immunoglobulin-like domain of bacterial spore germination
VTRALLLLAAGLVLAGCGGDSSAETTSAAETTPVKVYFLRDGKVWPALREVETTDDFASAAVDQLVAGPTEQEQADLGFSSEVPDPDAELSRAGLAQLVYTLTQFSRTDSVEVDGDSYTRADFEDQTPSVLVESPLPFEEVSSPLRATGTANTFEATFNYELVDGDGKLVDDHFVTATSLTGTRGTFDFTTQAFEDVAALRVFERSAEDGSKIHIVEIPLRMSQ